MSLRLPNSPAVFRAGRACGLALAQLSLPFTDLRPSYLLPLPTRDCLDTCSHSHTPFFGGIVHSGYIDARENPQCTTATVVCGDSWKRHQKSANHMLGWGTRPPPYVPSPSVAGAPGMGKCRFCLKAIVGTCSYTDNFNKALRAQAHCLPALHHLVFSSTAHPNSAARARFPPTSSRRRACRISTSMRRSSA